jgi:transposase
LRHCLHLPGGEVFNGVVYILSTGCQWRAIPKDLPPRSTLFHYLAGWEADGTLRRIQHELYRQCREQAERRASPSAGILDSQRVKSTEKGGAAWIHRVMMQANRSKEKSATC